MFWVTVFWTTWTWNLNEFHVLKMELDSVQRDWREGLTSPEKEVGRPLLLPRPHSWGRPHCPAGVKREGEHPDLHPSRSLFRKVSWSTRSCGLISLWLFPLLPERHLPQMLVLFPGDTSSWLSSIETRLMSAVLSWPHIPRVDSEKCERCHDSLNAQLCCSPRMVFRILMRCWMYVSDPGSWF